MRVIIIGGVAGGASAAARLRRLDESCEILMIEKGPYISFANCGLPYYIGEVIQERSSLLLQTPEAFNARFNVDVRVNNEVIAIDKKKKEITIKNVKTEESYTEKYDKLILSPGSTPLFPPIPGINDVDNIFTLWTIPDVDKIKAIVDQQKPKKAVVLGGGFIGLEMVENLVDRGIEVSLVELADQVMQPVDFEMAQIAHKEIGANGVKLYLNNGVKSFVKKEGLSYVQLSDGTQLQADLIMMSLGVKPQTELVKESGIELNKRGGIVVDETLKTSDDNIYAVGDAIEVVDTITGEKTMIPLAGPANKQGRIVAANVLGGKSKYKSTQGTSIAKIFDLDVAATGISEKRLIASGKKYEKDYDVVILHPKSHAGYYPGAEELTLKMIFDPKNGKVLGAQSLGYGGVDKRIDVLAAVIRMGGTIYDLTELELAYAPPHSSAKDPVNMAGFVAENMMEGIIKNVTWEHIDTIKKPVMLDVRDDLEFENGTIEGSILMPVNDVRSRYKELNRDDNIVIFCGIGIRGYIAARILVQKGFKNIYNLSGGYKSYHNSTWEFECDFSSTLPADYNAAEGIEQEMAKKMEEIHKGEILELDACGLSCPGPIKAVFNKMASMKSGDVVIVKVTDRGFKADISSWCKRTGNTLLDIKKEGTVFVARIRKGLLEQSMGELHALSRGGAPAGNDKTIVVFSGDLDKALASFIIANGAAAMGRKVTMFFTFWGLNVLREGKKVKVKKDVVSKMFGAMMPRGASKLTLSQMSMGGMGGAMIKGLMKKYNVPQLKEQIEMAIEAGVEIIACQMSMDLMGIKEEELVKGVSIAGVATYLDAAEDSNVNLFI